MATSWVLGKVSDAIAPTIHNTVSTAGSYAGGAVATVGNSINGVGEGINSSIRRYGDGAKDYGNSIMDWSKAPASRVQTASNPLGLSGSTASGKGAVTAPKVYTPPKSASKVMTTTSKSTAGASKKPATTAPKGSVPPPNKAMAGAKSSVPASVPKAAPGTYKKPVTVKRAPVKPSTASATNRAPIKGASNPLGLSV